MVSKTRVMLFFKGFAMGTADIVPGVSGGTIALITGIYDQLVHTISQLDHQFFKYLVTAKFKEAYQKINPSFLIPLFIGIASAIVAMAKLMHFLMESYSVYTWSAFFGLILASIIVLLKQIPQLRQSINLFGVFAGTVIGYLVVTLIPVQTPENYLMVFGAGMIAICAMILPGISGSFILLILGKYYFITGMIKDPFHLAHLLYIGVFCLGCLLGLISFSKVLNKLLNNHYSLTMCILVGFMIGSLKKIWPWKKLSDQLVPFTDPEKAKLLADELYLPSQFSGEVIFAFAIMVISFLIVYLIEKSFATRR
ncbi:MAG: DUF368 domain-containing protein [Halobacteriovoraceae bacterium]|nr:DUF368 domain-containing protein [Halobacteriovoraceae bacterium]|tara:strand:+ start:16176 stop:17105 length:930 start_codon:yes stop_codon:yes gene_type:complete